MISNDSIVKINEALVEARASDISLRDFKLPPESGFNFTEAETVRVEGFIKEALSKHNAALLDYIDGELVGVDGEGRVIIQEGGYHFENQEPLSNAPQSATVDGASIPSYFPSERVEKEIPQSFVTEESIRSPGREEKDVAFGSTLDANESYAFNGFARATSADEVFEALNQNKLVELPTSNEMSSFIAHMENKGASFNLQSVCDDKSGMFKISGMSDKNSQMLMYLERALDKKAPEIFSFTSDMAIVDIDGKYYLGAASKEWDFTPSQELIIGDLDGKGMNSVSILRDFNRSNSKQNLDEENERRGTTPSILSFGFLSKKGTKSGKKFNFLGKELEPGKLTADYMNSQLDSAMKSLAKMKSADVFDPTQAYVSDFKDSMKNMGATIETLNKMNEEALSGEGFRDFFERYEKFSQDMKSFQRDLAKQGSGIIDLGKNMFNGESVKALAQAMERMLNNLSAQFGGN
jgi:uncharacterized protein YukE